MSTAISQITLARRWCATATRPADLSRRGAAERAVYRLCDRPAGTPIAEAAGRLVALRDRWLNPPEWVEWVQWTISGSGQRTVPGSAVQQPHPELPRTGSRPPPLFLSARSKTRGSISIWVQNRLSDASVHGNRLIVQSGLPARYNASSRSPRQKLGEHAARHCQLVEGSALLPREIDAPDRFQQAHVTASHSTNARVRSRRW